MYDDGRGKLREKVFNFSHEKDNGRTSSIAHEIIGFDSKGMQVYPTTGGVVKDNVKKKQVWPKIVESSSKIVQLIDLCGHEKYLKTTMFGLTGLFPQYAMVVVAANKEITRMTKEHIGIAISLKIPLLVVITKIDMAPEDVYRKTVGTLQRICNTFCHMKPVLIKEEENPKFLDTLAASLSTNTICPIFSVSNVTGAGIEQLKQFLFSIPVNEIWGGLTFNNEEESSIMQ
jgi:GTPase